MDDSPTPEEIEASLHELFAPLDRLGPGSPDTTRRALALVPDLSERSRAIELGCGCGAASVTLAAMLPGKLAAIDRHPPFIARLRERAEQLGLAARIDARVGDMREPGVELHSMDLVWAEGSLYAIGWDEGLELCRRLLAPGGVMGVSEAAWLRETPSAEVQAFWAEHYPQMRTHARLSTELREKGFVVHGEFVVPRSDWEAYYDGLRERVADFAERSDPAARAVAAIVANEIQIHERYADEFGLVFFVASVAR